jgi:hypothetical protein
VVVATWSHRLQVHTCTWPCNCSSAGPSGCRERERRQCDDDGDGLRQASKGTGEPQPQPPASSPMCACIEIHRSGSSSPGWTCLCLLVLDLMEEERIRTSLEAFGHSIRPHAREAVTGLHRVAASARPLLLAHCCCYCLSCPRIIHSHAVRLRPGSFSWETILL